MVSVEQVIYVVPVLALTASIIYYSLNLRNSNKNQKIAFETRQVQYLLEYNNVLVERTLSNLNFYFQIMSAEWTDFNDYYEKYGPENNAELNSFRSSLWNRFNAAGLMIRDGMIDVKMYVDYVGDAPVMMWYKYRDIVEEYRRRFHLPSYLAGWEILAVEIEKYRTRQGWDPKTPDDMPYSFTQ
jgi:hypothetical protein